jgi:hypothetical protein
MPYTLRTIASPEERAMDPPAQVVHAEPARQHVPYPPSWVDRLQAGLDRLPWPPWIAYLGAWGVFAVAETLAKWSDGSYPVGTVFPFHLVAFGTAAYGLGMLHFLKRSAARALASSRPLLPLDDDAYHDLRRRLTTMPAAPVAIATLLGMAFGTFQRQALVAPHVARFHYAVDGPLAVYEFIAVPLVTWGVIAVFTYGTLRQARLIDTIYRGYLTIDLFRVRPLYAFAAHAARTSIGLLAIGYLWVVTYPRDLGQAVMGLFTSTLLLLTALATALFLASLWGAHQRLEAEKQRRTADALQRLGAVLAHQRELLDARSFAAVDATAKAIAGLNAELAYLQQASTWPWPVTMLRTFVTAMLVPLVVFVAQRILQSRFGL